MERLVYPDFCKFLAIFLVTCSHCAQSISGIPWTNFLGGTYLDIAFNMPLFMILGGWFLNIEYLRSINLLCYIKSKFLRLILPAISWYIILCVASYETPRFGGFVTSYWYLKALFISLCVICIFTKIIKNDIICAIVSIICFLAIPIPDLVYSKFMFPFIWGGYYLRRFYEGKDNKIKIYIFLCFVVGILLAFMWSPDKTVYRCPFDVLTISINMVIIYIYRFIIGFALSSVIIWMAIKYENRRFVFGLSKYGSFSLVIYTGSFVLNELLRRLFCLYNMNINEYIFIDFLSLLSSSLIVVVLIAFSKCCRHNKYISIFLLGE